MRNRHYNLQRLPAQPLALMYHSIRPGNATPQWTWAVALERFRDQLRLLADEGWTTVTTSELHAGAPVRPGTVALTFDDGYVDNLAAVEALAARNMRATWFIVSGSIGRTPAWTTDAPYGDRLLNVAELRRMREQGMEIGSHGQHHRRMTELTSEQVRRELCDSKADLETLLGADIASFAYPYGHVSDDIVEQVRAAGYRVACTTRSGRIGPEDDPLRMRRVTIFAGDDLAAFARKLVFADTDVGWRKMARYYGARLLARIGRKP